MLSYIILFFIIAILILAIIRFSKPRYPKLRSQHEPFVGMHQIVTVENEPDHEGIIGEPRIVRHNPARMTPSENTSIEAHPAPILDPSPHLKTETRSVAPASNDLEPTDVIVMNLIADPERPYAGYELLQTILNKGFRYGKWHIFHFHVESAGHGPTLFSLASSIEPGTFDLAKMETFSTHGLTLFMRISNTNQPLKAMEKCLQIADQITIELGGKVYDEKRRPVTHKTIQDWQKACRLSH